MRWKGFSSPCPGYCSAPTLERTEKGQQKKRLHIAKCVSLPQKHGVNRYVGDKRFNPDPVQRQAAEQIGEMLRRGNFDERPFGETLLDSNPQFLVQEGNR